MLTLYFCFIFFKFLQPEPFLHELASLKGNDGPMDRFLVFSAKPTFHKTAILRENLELLQDSHFQNFNKVMEGTFLGHRQGQNYHLSDAAQNAYDEIFVCFCFDSGLTSR